MLFRSRVMPNTNTMALEHIKNSDALNYIEDENLKQKIQAYSSIATSLKIREQREYNFIDKYMDPLTITWFEYNFYNSISNEDSFEIKGDKIIVKTKIPDGLKLIKQNAFDWNNYFSILGMLSTIRKSTDRSYISPSQAECLSLLGQVRAYLKENNALIE